MASVRRLARAGVRAEISYIAGAAMKRQRGNHKITAFFAPPSKRAVPDGATSASADRGTTHDRVTSTSGDLARILVMERPVLALILALLSPSLTPFPGPVEGELMTLANTGLDMTDNGSTTTHGCSTCRVRGCIVSIVNLTPKIAKTSPRYGT